MKAAITGHQNLGPQKDWIKSQLSELVDTWKVTYGLTCLAKGADQIFAQVLIEHTIPYQIIIPAQDYECTFSPTEIDDFHYFVNSAKKRVDLAHHKASEQSFFDASKLMVLESDLVFAVWNGKPAEGLGGTADVVEFAKENNKPIIHINPVNLKVKEI